VATETDILIPDLGSYHLLQLNPKFAAPLRCRLGSCVFSAKFMESWSIKKLKMRQKLVLQRDPRKRFSPNESDDLGPRSNAYLALC